VSGGLSDVVALPVREARTASAVLAACFVEDPLSAWLFPHPGRRQRVLQSLFLATIRDALRFSSVDAVYARGRLCGVSVSLPPGAFPPTRGRSARLLPTFALLAARYPRALRRAFRVMAADADAHVEGPHWYAQALGVEADHRGQGAGTALLEAILRRADRDRTSTFLVTSNPPNLEWYRRYGFVESNEIRARPEAPPFWPMERPAGSPTETPG
jgi:ribosomal protein S18 acetylase RimI-like enzyme